MVLVLAPPIVTVSGIPSVTTAEVLTTCPPPPPPPPPTPVALPPLPPPPTARMVRVLVPIGTMKLPLAANVWPYLTGAVISVPPANARSGLSENVILAVYWTPPVATTCGPNGVCPHVALACVACASGKTAEEVQGGKKVRPSGK